MKKVSYNAKSYLLLNLIKILDLKKKLPVIFFVFSRKGCENYCTRIPSIDLLNKREKSRVHTFIQKALKKIPQEDRNLPQIEFVAELIKRGIGLHHSGLLPILKEIVEIMFHKGFIRILFATETFAMGVNMPARSVVFVGLKKHDGTQFREILPGEYTQMSGRAGRRGYDTVGTVIATAFEEVPDLKSIATGKPLTLQSKFRLTYQTILSILKLSGSDLSVTDMMRSSFGEFNKSFNNDELLQGKKLLQLTQHKYQGLISQSKLSEEDVLKLDHLLSDMKLVSEIAKDLSLVIWDNKKYQKILKIGRIILVIPELGRIFPEPMVIVDKNSSKGTQWLVCTYLKNSEKRQDIRSDWIMGITNSFVTEQKKFSQMGIISLGKKVSLNYSQLDEYNQTRNILDQLLQCNLQWDTPMQESTNHITKLEIENSHERIWLQKKIHKMSKQLSDETLSLMPDYNQRLRILQDLEYIDTDEIVLTKGNICREINTCNELLLTEFLMNGYLENLEPGEIAAVLSMLITNDKNLILDEELQAINTLNSKVGTAISQMYQLLDKTLEIQLKHGLDIDPEKYQKSISPAMVITVLKWCEGENFNHICQYSDIMEGTIVRNMLRLDEVILEVGKIGELIGNHDMKNKMEAASHLIKRSIVYTGSLYI